MGAMWYVTGHSSKEVPMAVVAEKKPFVVWMGWLRLFALLLVCVCHACDPLSAFGTGAEKTWIAWIGSAARPCVPLFVMLTGALLLPVNEGFGGMCRRRVSRLVWPFLLWTAVYAALPWLLATCGVAVEMIQRVFFPFAAPLHTDAPSIARAFFLSLFQFNQYAVQLWYIYLLVGLYLFMLRDAFLGRPDRRPCGDCLLGCLPAVGTVRLEHLRRALYVRRLCGLFGAGARPAGGTVVAWADVGHRGAVGGRGLRDCRAWNALDVGAARVHGEDV